MSSRDYYSKRTGQNNNRTWDLNAIKNIFLSVFEEFSSNNYFGKPFGYLGNRGWVAGEICKNNDDECIQRYFLRKLRKNKSLWPISTFIPYYEEDDLFDVIELIHDLITKPYARNPYLRDDDYKPATRSDFSDVEVVIMFNETDGKDEFRIEINNFLIAYDEGFELSKEGEIRLVGNKDLSNLFNQEVPSSGNEDIDQRIKKAISKFRHHRSSDDDKKTAIIELDQVRELLQNDIILLGLTNDEKKLTEIANNFAIRHLKGKQKNDFQKTIFYTWIFSSYLSLIYLILRLKNHQSHDEISV